MKKPKPESRRVRKFLRRLILFTLLLAAVVGAYVLIDDKDYDANQAEAISQEVKTELERDIDQSLHEIDEWVALLVEKQQATDRDHREHIKDVLVIKEALLEAKHDLSENDSNIQGLQAEVNHLINQFEQETEQVSFSVTTSVDS